MKVVAAINGSVSAEFMTFYAIKYAEVQNCSLILLHIKNSKDDTVDVEASMKRISTLADAHNVETEFIILNGSIKKTIRNFFCNYAQCRYCFL